MKKYICFLLILMATGLCHCTIKAQVVINELGMLHLGDQSFTHNIYNFNINKYKGLYWTYGTNKFFRIVVPLNNQHYGHLRICAYGNAIWFKNTENNLFNTIEVNNYFETFYTTQVSNITSIQNGLEKINATIPLANYDNQGESQSSFSIESLKEALPNLIVSDDSGHTLMNESGIIPYMINAIQSLKKQVELQDVKIKKLRSGTDEVYKSNSFIHVSGISSEVNALCELKISPNPFKSLVDVYCSLPDNIKKASLRISKLNGQLVDNLIVKERGNYNLQINGSTWVPGYYLCSLIVDGTIVQTRKIYKE